MTRKEFLAFGKPNFSDQEIDAVAKVLRSGWIGMGPETLAFEKELGEFFGAPHVVTVNSCTSALFLSLLVRGVAPGDEVICPSFTWCSTANAALYLGAKPVFCDVDPDTLCITAEFALQKLTPKTKAIMVVHMAGLGVDVNTIRAALPENVAIIEDAAHALGAKFDDGKPVGSSGNMSCFSFYANKNLSTGEGGAIALFDAALADRLRSLRLHALPADAWKRFTNPKSIVSRGLEELGYKMNYTDLQACIGRVQLRRQAEFHRTRLAIANRYHDRLSKRVPGIKFQHGLLHPHHARHLFQIMLPLEETAISRDALLLELRNRNIGANVHYLPLHTMPLYSAHGHASLPNTEKVCERILTLPISGSMSLDDADYVILNLEELLNEHRR